MSDNVELRKLRTQLATTSALLASSQMERAKLVDRVRQAEEMTGLLQQSDPNAEQVAALIIRHMEQSHATLAHHQMNLIQTTAVALENGLELSDDDLRNLVNTCCKGLRRALQTMQQVKLKENSENATARTNHLKQVAQHGKEAKR